MAANTTTSTRLRSALRSSLSLWHPGHCLLYARSALNPLQAAPASRKPTGLGTPKRLYHSGERPAPRVTFTQGSRSHADRTLAEIALLRRSRSCAAITLRCQRGRISEPHDVALAAGHLSDPAANRGDDLRGGHVDHL